MANPDGKDLVKRRSPEWAEHATRWRWLLDSLEGGDRYRYAIYGYDRYARMPVRNLVRHKREDDRDGQDLVANAGVVYAAADSLANAESVFGFGYGYGYGSGGAGAAAGLAPAYDPAFSTDNDYGLRLARTPVPTFVQEALGTHLSRIYAREVRRPEANPAALVAWWADVDGRGTTIDDWMADTVAPLLMVLGQLDVLMDHPPAPAGEPVATQADVNRLGLGRCVASYILPENMVWWRLGPDGSYAECLVRECSVGADGEPVERYRHWDAAGSTLRDRDGEAVESTPHAFGRVPIVRLFDRRKPRCENVGQSRYEALAEIQREYYNRDSELILSDTTHAHPILQGPEDYIEADGTVPIGPNWLLPKKKTANGAGVHYEGFGVVDFPKDGAKSIRENKADLRDEADRGAHLTKPAGAAGTQGATVGQSGLSKRLDATAGNDVLAKVAAALAKAEVALAKLALAVLAEGDPAPADLAAIVVHYARQFDLATPTELMGEVAGFQGCLAAAGNCPEVEVPMLSRAVRLLMPGADDADYAAYDAAVAAAVARRAAMPDPKAQEAAVVADSNATRTVRDDDEAPIGESNVDAADGVD